MGGALGPCQNMGSLNAARGTRSRGGRKKAGLSYELKKAQNLLLGRGDEADMPREPEAGKQGKKRAGCASPTEEKLSAFRQDGEARRPDERSG